MSSHLNVGNIKKDIAKLLSDSIENFVIWKGIDQIERNESDIDCFIEPEKIELAIQTINKYLILNGIRTKAIICKHIQGTTIYCILYGNPFIEIDFTSLTTTLGGHKGANWNFMMQSPRKTDKGITVANEKNAAIVKFLLDLDARKIEYINSTEIKIDNIQFSKKEFERYLKFICPTLTRNLITLSCFQTKNLFTKYIFISLKTYIRILILLKPIQLSRRLINRWHMRRCFVIQSIIVGGRDIEMLKRPEIHQRYPDKFIEIGT